MEEDFKQCLQDLLSSNISEELKDRFSNSGYAWEEYCKDMHFINKEVNLNIY